MPDLSHKAVHQFWYDYQDPIIYRVIAFMEGVEDWTIDDDPQFEEAILNLGNALEDIGNIDLQLEENMIDVVAHTKTGRGLRLLMCLDTAYPGAAAKVLMKAEEDTKSEQDTPGIFLRRNIVFERLRLLTRVFAPDRFKLITKALEDGVYD
ncbi:MAG: type IVB secretion system protein IcmW [Gammaproteobacteria bacterium]|nr:type IVB secretion system protein IcmW [Gammaproteobacteria bacterium]MCH9744883.1 type IVB secretion system protein IcmW [Gammaproteobacteria bacterium]